VQPPLSTTPLPASAARTTTTTSDRHPNRPPYDASRGGDPLPSQHSFRPPGHPEAHTPISPAPRLTSEIPPAMNQRTIHRRDPMLIAPPITGIPGRTVRGHHTPIAGFDTDTRAYHTSATPITAIPTGTKTLNRSATLRPSRSPSITPSSFITGSPLAPSSSGSTRMTPANSITDTPLHDPHPATGHSHHTPSLGAAHTFPGAFYNH
jgi:heme/copper-type cytochrome/quinol oxidase subunit 1